MRVPQSVEARMVAEWHTILKRAWSIRIALFWGAVSGLYSAWDAFQSLMPAWLFASLSMIMSASLVGARLTKQTGVDDA